MSDEHRNRIVSILLNEEALNLIKIALYCQGASLRRKAALCKTPEFAAHLRTGSDDYTSLYSGLSPIFEDADIDVNKQEVIVKNLLTDKPTAIALHMLYKDEADPETEDGPNLLIING